MALSAERGLPPSPHTGAAALARLPAAEVRVRVRVRIRVSVRVRVRIRVKGLGLGSGLPAAAASPGAKRLSRAPLSPRGPPG